MGTRCNIHFNHGKRVDANIYVHMDGYPGGVSGGRVTGTGILADLLEFFQLVKAEVRDTRFGDAEELASKFVVWKSQKQTKYSVRCDFNEEGKYVPAEEPYYLNFLGVCPCIHDHGDIEWVYEVDCDKHDCEGLPAVRVKRAGAARFRTVYLCGKAKKTA